MTSVDPLVAHLVEARKKAGLSQAKVAGTVGFSCATSGRLSEYETGRRQPSLATLRRWAQVLGFEPTWVPLAYETAPVVELAAGSGATEGGLKSPPDAPASAPASLHGAGSDVAPVIDVPRALAERCPRCEGTRTEAMRWVGPGAGDWRPIVCTLCSPVLRTLDVAERTVEKAREARR